MARLTAYVGNDMVFHPDKNTDGAISVGTPVWFDWLTHTTSFAFHGDSIRFTARKEQVQRGGWYWKAYRKHQGKLRSIYLGATANLTVARLTATAQAFGDLSEKVVSASAPSLTPNKALKPPPHPIKEILLQTKVLMPPLGAKLLARTRLTTRMEIGQSTWLTLVCAPAGAGKTTLLREWLAGYDRRCAWISLDANDNDLMRFWRYVLVALAPIAPAISQRALSGLDAPATLSITAFLMLLLNDITATPQRIILVLDDYHTIETPAIHASVAYVLAHMPPSLCIVIATRTAPPLPLAYLRAQQQLTELLASDLRFLHEEIVAFCTDILSQHLTTQAIALLETYSEGWITGIQLAALLLGDEDLTARIHTFIRHSPDTITDYLLEEVLERQREPLRTFLLQTSILEHVHSSLCNAMTGRDDSQALLQRIERSNLFLTPVEESYQWYRYHPLFAEALQVRLRQERPEEIASLHSKAAHWYLDHGSATEAFSHALAASDYALATRILAASAPTLLERSEMEIVRRQMAAIPDSYIRCSAYLCWLLAKVQVADRHLHEAAAYLDRAEQLVTEVTPDTQPGAPAMVPLACEIASTRAEIAFHCGAYQQAIVLHKQALAYLPPDATYLRAENMANQGTAYVAAENSVAAIYLYNQARIISRAAGNKYATLGTCAQLGSLYQLQAQLPAAEAMFWQGIHAVNEEQGWLPPLASIAYVGIGRVCYEHNDCEQAQRYLQQGLALGKQREDINVLLRAYTSLARIAHLRHDKVQFQAMRNEVEQLAQHPQLPPHTASLAASYCLRLALLQGESAAAQHWATIAAVESHDPLSYLKEITHIAHARFLFTQGKFAEAHMFLERLRQAAEAAARWERVMEIEIVQAQVFQAQHDMQRALSMLAAALSIGESGGYIRMFADEGAALAMLLVQLYREQRRSTTPAHFRYIKHVLAACANAPLANTTVVPQMLVEPLSLREMEILAMLVAGKTNRDIAEALIVEISTVKWHVQHIFQKLGIKSRTQAVYQAHVLGIFS